ncbi:MAG: hypothetical protein KDB65_02560 [Calditrichaeota bacterium]|nr:hypothetical protein [Calditrichota bacterium]MCB9367993.1 hypothetical protein [Calditrichota bacterium]
MSTIKADEPLQTTREAEEIRNRKILWWFLALVSTAAGVVVPFMLTDQAGTIMWTLSIVASGMILGLLDSRKPWVFPVLLALGYSAAGTLLGGFGNLPDLLVRLQLGATLAIPAAIGSYAGAVLRKLARGRLQVHGKETPRSARWIALAIGSISSIIFVKIPGQVGIFYSFTLLLGAALILGYMYSDRLWRWVMLLGYGIPLAALMRTILELYYYPEANGLFPIELSLAMALAVLPTLLGTMAGRALHRYRLRTH